MIIVDLIEDYIACTETNLVQIPTGFSIIEPKSSYTEEIDLELIDEYISKRDSHTISPNRYSLKY